MPLGPVPPEDGSLLVAAGSHRLPAFADLRAGYGQTQVRSSALRPPPQRHRSRARLTALDSGHASEPASTTTSTCSKQHSL